MGKEIERWVRLKNGAIFPIFKGDDKKKRKKTNDKARKKHPISHKDMRRARQEVIDTNYEYQKQWDKNYTGSNTTFQVPSVFKEWDERHDKAIKKYRNFKSRKKFDTDPGTLQDVFYKNKYR